MTKERSGAEERAQVTETGNTQPAIAALQAALAARCVIERELGRGGMATVYLARDLRHRRLVAIKVLAADLSQSLGAERFLREIELVDFPRGRRVARRPVRGSGCVQQACAGRRSRRIHSTLDPRLHSSTRRQVR